MTRARYWKTTQPPRDRVILASGWVATVEDGQPLAGYPYAGLAVFEEAGGGWYRVTDIGDDALYIVLGDRDAGDVFIVDCWLDLPDAALMGRHREPVGGSMLYPGPAKNRKGGTQ